MTKEKKFLSDKVANILLNDKEQIEYIRSIISKSTGIEREKLENLELLSNRINENVNTKYSYADAMYEDVTDIFNIECNISNSDESRNKNTRYCSQLILKQVKPGKKDILKLVWQININDYDEVGNGKFINKSKLITEDNCEREFPLRIIDINVDKLRDMEYTKLKGGAEDSLEKLL